MNAFERARHFLEQITDVTALESAIAPHARELFVPTDTEIEDRPRLAEYARFVREGAYDNDDFLSLNGGMPSVRNAILLGIAIGAGMGRLTQLTFHVPEVHTGNGAEPVALDRGDVSAEAGGDAIGCPPATPDEEILF